MQNTQCYFCRVKVPMLCDWIPQGGVLHCFCLLQMYNEHDDIIKCKHFRSPVNSSRKGQWREALMLSLICAWINGWIVRLLIWDAINPLWRHCNEIDMIHALSAITSLPVGETQIFRGKEIIRFLLIPRLFESPRRLQWWCLLSAMVLSCFPSE